MHILAWRLYLGIVLSLTCLSLSVQHNMLVQSSMVDSALSLMFCPSSLLPSLSLPPFLPLSLPPPSLSLLLELDSSGDHSHLADIPSARKPKRGAEIRRRRVSKSRGSPYRTSQGSSGHEDMDGHPSLLTPPAMGGVAFSTATATTVTTDGGVVEDKPATVSPAHCTSDEGEHILTFFSGIYYSSVSLAYYALEILGRGNQPQGVGNPCAPCPLSLNTPCFRRISWP